MKNIEIYGTLGPSCCSKELLKQMFQAGMTGIRLNLSHRSLEDCATWLEALHSAADDLHILPDLLVDLQGPELRIGALKKTLTLTKGMTVQFMDSEEYDHALLNERTDPSISTVIPVPEHILSYLKEGQLIKLDDGKLHLTVSDADHYLATVNNDGLLSSKKSILLDGVSIPLPTLTNDDLENIKQFRRFRVTGVMLPFVRNAKDLLTLKQELSQHGLSYIRIFAKIENIDGVHKLPELIPHADHIVIARGDLGNAVSLTRLPAVQKKIAHFCNQTKAPFMVVTQMLASMEHSLTPTRAEVCDIFNAILDGASSVMLTGETASGDYPVEAIRVMSDTVFEAIRFLTLPQSFLMDVF